MNHYSSAASPASTPFFPSGPDYVYYIYIIFFFQTDTICTTGYENGARCGYTEAAQIERAWATTVLSCDTPATVDTISASDCTILFMCDLRIILYVEKDAIYYDSNSTLTRSCVISCTSMV